MRLDHVTIAGPDLDMLRHAFARVGLASVYGGPHSNGVTHMALIPFPDGSYIELISTLRPGERSPWWHAHIAAGGGPCAWALEVEDVEAEAARAADSGVPVRGPFPMSRRRPDGRLLEWDLAFLGQQEPGAVLPFVIRDRTPRAWRVPPHDGDDDQRLGGIAGVSAVVIGVPDLEATSAAFRRLYDWPPPESGADTWLSATLLRFPGTPVVLASPARPGGWLDERLARFGASPCAFLLASRDPDRSAGAYAEPAPRTFLDLPVAWLDPDRLAGARVGFCPRV